MKIHKLPADVRSHIQSGITITDATQCVLELVHNSLDAAASKIAVKVNLKKFQIQVSDNGNGITRDDLNLLGERYMTSKCRGIKDLEGVISTYGYRGQAIASLLDVSSSVKIETKSSNEKYSLVKVFLKTKALPVSISKKDQSSLGTMITVEDFMSTMPVRRKRINDIFDLQGIKTHIEYLAIIHYEVCFTLYDENKSALLLQTHKKKDPVFSLADFYGYAPTSSLIRLNLKSGNFEITGFIGPENYHQIFQLVYVNKRIVHKNEIHKLVNKLITKYLKEKKGKEDPEEHHVFLIDIRCPYNVYEMTLTVKKSKVEFKDWDFVLKSVYRSVKSVLKNDDKDDSLKEEKKDKKKVHPLKLFKKKEGDVNPEFGTSRLITGVRGVPVKRKLSSSTPKIPTKMKKVENFIDKTMDSESPIPKNRVEIFKKPPPRSEKSSEEFVLRAFEKWLKSKAKSSSDASNFYKEFVNFKRNIGVDIPDSSFNETVSSPCEIPEPEIERKKNPGINFKLTTPKLNFQPRNKPVTPSTFESSWKNLANLRNLSPEVKNIRSPYFDSFIRFNDNSPKVSWQDKIVQTSFVEEEKSKIDRSVQVSMHFAESEDEGFCSENVKAKSSPDKPAGFSLADRFGFVPKGLSPNFMDSHPANIPDLNSQEKNRIRDSLPNSENFLDNVKWLNSEKSRIPDKIFEDLGKETEEKMIYYENDILSASVNKSAIKVHNLLNSFSFSKELLLNIKVVGQLDEKFIVTLMRISDDKNFHLLTLFDQHAVDERIHLERLLDEYRTSDGWFKSTQTKLICSLNESTVEVISHFQEKLQIYGIKLKIINADTVSVEEVPTCLYDKNERNFKNEESKSLDYLIQNLLVDIGEELMQTRGNGSTIPKVIRNVISSQACRSAVKFNQSLTVDEMRNMMSALAECNLPFQCAHGRPSIAPIIDLEDFKNSVSTDRRIDCIQRLKNLVRGTEGISAEDDSV